MLLCIFPLSQSLGWVLIEKDLSRPYLQDSESIVCKKRFASFEALLVNSTGYTESSISQLVQVPRFPELARRVFLQG